MMQSFSRLRRYRLSSRHRDLFKDVCVRTEDLVIPIFIQEGKSDSSIDSMPFVKRHSIDQALKYIEKKAQCGFFTFMVFPAIEKGLKEPQCRAAFETEGLVPRALRQFKKNFPQCLFIADVALDPYHPEGQDGLTDPDGYVNNDRTLVALAEQALVLAHAGADIVAPSDMMDGRIGSIRQSLDQRGLIKTLIASYSLKYCSEFYGPFRDAVKSKDNLGAGDKKSYQMAFDSSFQIDLELEADLNEGADIAIIKPALSYLDVIYRASQITSRPLWAYHVSGECALLHQGAKAGLFDLERALYEQFIAIKRAGASKIITYLSDQAKSFLL